jgi:hypothetical protein
VFVSIPSAVYQIENTMLGYEREDFSPAACSRGCGSSRLTASAKRRYVSTLAITMRASMVRRLDPGHRDTDVGIDDDALVEHQVEHVRQPD